MKNFTDLVTVTIGLGFTKKESPVSINVRASEDGTDQSQNGTGSGGTPPGK